MPTPEQIAKYNANRRTKYAASADVRARKSAQYQRWREKHGDRHNAERRERYRYDEAYRERHNARKRGRDQRNDQLKIHYGITLAEYNAMLAAQGGVCAICHRHNGKTLHVDHCHATKRVRGLLCGPCNVGLGCYEDNEERMRAAIEYLRAA